MKKRITKMISIKKRINITDELKEFIFKNINYRRAVYNDFVEESRNYESIFDFNPLKYKTSYFNDIEKPNNVYDEYCVGISEQVAKDMKSSLKSIKSNKHWKSKFSFKSFDRFRGSFMVNCKPDIKNTSSDGKSGVNKLYSRISIVDDSLIFFRERCNSKIIISLKEPLFDDVFYTNNTYPFFYNKEKQYYFSEEDIKEISFIHELGKFYIVLFTEVKYLINIDKILKKNICGIDLGIHNPCMLYDGKSFKQFRLNERELKRIMYLERRIRRLQQIMDNKLLINNGKKSKNYYKVLKKFRITHKKIFNIRLNWRRKVAKKISDEYSIVCIDNFKQPGQEVHEFIGLNKNIIRKLNSYNRIHGTSYLYKAIIHSVEKTGGIILNSPKNTTRTCSVCGHKNKKLLLSQRYIQCAKCDNIIDRDMNASVNCYKHILDMV